MPEPAEIIEEVVPEAPPVVPEGGEVTPEVVPPESGEADPEPVVPVTEPEKTVSYEEYQKAQARANWAERELKRKEQEAAQPEPARPEPVQTPTGVPPKPVSSDFESWDDFNEALMDWKTDRRFEEREAKDLQKAAESEAKERQTSIQQRVDIEAAKNPKYFEESYIPKHLVDIVADSEQLIEISYYFRKNMQEATRIAYLPPVQAAREIGRIEAKLQNTVPQRTQTSAPTATKPIITGNEIIEKKLEDMSTREFIDHRNRQEFGGT